MPLFLSTHVNKVDKKGRVSVPSTFRAALADQTFQGVVLFRSNNHDCLECFAYSYMEELGERLDNFDLFSAEQDNLSTAIFAEAVQLPLDKDGRIILTSALIDYAGVDDTAAFVGMGQKFQIWQPARLEKRRVDARKSVKSKGLTVPKNVGASS